MRRGMMNPFSRVNKRRSRNAYRIGSRGKRLAAGAGLVVFLLAGLTEAADARSHLPQDGSALMGRGGKHRTRNFENSCSADAGCRMYEAAVTGLDDHISARNGWIRVS
jgi:hypothetical protein